MIANYGWLILCIALLWLLQLLLSLIQTKKFHKSYSELRKKGDISSIGMAGSNWKLKVYAILVVDSERIIINAEKLSGITVFARMKSVESLVGQPLSILDQFSDTFGINKKLWSAFEKAAEYIRVHDRKM